MSFKSCSLTISDTNSLDPSIIITEDTIFIPPIGQFLFSIDFKRVLGPTGTQTIQANWTEYELNSRGELVRINENKGSAVGKKTYIQSGLIPPNLTESDISYVNNIYLQVFNGQISQSTAQAKLDDLATRIGKNALAWIVRNFPIYNDQSNKWLSFDIYPNNLAQEYNIPENSRLGQDPVGTEVDLLFGNPSSEEIIYWLGFNY